MILFGIMLRSWMMVLSSVNFVAINLMLLPPFRGSNGIYLESKGVVLKYVTKFLNKFQDAARAGSSNNDVANPISASAEEQNYGGRHVETAQQGAVEDWMDSITDKEIELMHDAFETIPRNRTSPASGES